METKFCPRLRPRKYASALIGNSYGRLVVVRYADVKNGRDFWTFRCECGNERDMNAGYVVTGQVQSCGCLQRERKIASRLSHGHTINGKRSPEYNSWTGMVQRCTNPNNPRWNRYGGRGIKVSERWRAAFESFLLDMGPRPKGTTLDRVDNNGNYELSNCRWAEPRDQSNNTNITLKLEYQGSVKPASEWSRVLGIDHNTLLYRIRRGWSVDRALSTKAVR